MEKKLTEFQERKSKVVKYYNFNKETKSKVKSAIAKYNDGVKAGKKVTEEGHLVYVSDKKLQIKYPARLFTYEGQTYLSYKTGLEKRLCVVTGIEKSKDGSKRYDVSYARNVMKIANSANLVQINFNKDVSDEEAEKFVEDAKTKTLQVVELTADEKRSRNKIVKAVGIGVLSIALTVGIVKGISSIPVNAQPGTPDSGDHENINDGNNGDQTQNPEQNPGQDQDEVGKEDALVESDLDTKNADVLGGIKSLLQKSGKTVGDDLVIDSIQEREFEDTFVAEGMGTVQKNDMCEYKICAKSGGHLYNITSITAKATDEKEFAGLVEDNATIFQEYQTVAAFTGNEAYYQDFKTALSKATGKEVSDVYMLIEQESTGRSFRTVSANPDATYRYDAHLMVAFDGNYENLEEIVYSTNAKSPKDIINTVQSAVVINNVPDRVRLEGTEKYIASGIGVLGYHAENNADSGMQA